MGVWLRIQSVIPEQISLPVEKQLFFGGEITNTKAKVGYVLTAPIIFGLAVAVNLLAFRVMTEPIGFILSLLFFSIIGYAGVFLLIKLAAVSRTRKLEESLPDALELVATNMKSGLTIENALVDSSRPEFGELSALLKRAAKQMFSGKSFEKAMQNASDMIDSELFNRTIWLLTEGMRKGGSIGELLLRISNDLRSESAMKKEINANISIYITLILISSTFGAPLLFGAGTVVAEMMTSQANNISTTTNTVKNAPGFISIFAGSAQNQERISPEMISLLSLASLTVTSFFAGILIGIIKYNKESEGMKYFLPMLVVSILIYLMSSTILRSIVLGK